MHIFLRLFIFKRQSDKYREKVEKGFPPAAFLGRLAGSGSEGELPVTTSIDLECWTHCTMTSAHTATCSARLVSLVLETVMPGIVSDS